MRRLGSVLALALLVVVGCGSSSKSSGSSANAGALSKADFIAQGDALCKDAESKTPKDPTGTDAKSMADYMGAGITVITGVHDKFAALQAPSDAQQLQKDFIAELDTALAASKSAKAKFDAGDVQGGIDLLQKAPDTTTADKALKDYGFKECTKSS